jgi:hypothetical protein
MKYFLTTLICIAALSGGHLAQASQNSKNDQPRTAMATTCQGEPVNVKGGKVVGEPGPKSKFKNLRLGMSRHVVHKQIGTPDDMGHKMTGKQFIPMYFGSDRMRSTEYYKGSGRLIFSGTDGSTLVEIHHDAGESGDRSLR